MSAAAKRRRPTASDIMSLPSRLDKSAMATQWFLEKLDLGAETIASAFAYLDALSC